MIMKDASAGHAKMTGLSLTCLAHMEQEEAMLGATLESLRQVRAALLGGDLGALQKAIDSQAATARAAEELRHRRAALRDQLARALELPASAVTIHAVIGQLRGDAAERLSRYRERLKHMTLEVDRINRGNAALVQHSVEFLHQLLVNVTGGEAVGDRYRPSGQIDRATYGSLFEGRA